MGKATVENSTCPLVSTSARHCRTRKDIPGTCPTGRVCTSTHKERKSYDSNVISIIISSFVD